METYLDALNCKAMDYDDGCTYILSSPPQIQDRDLYYIDSLIGPEDNSSILCLIILCQQNEYGLKPIIDQLYSDKDLILRDIESLMRLQSMCNRFDILSLYISPAKIA